ncbi:hypothetical protein BC835DRAFT_564957 [Cytidiella melzeri]|nr:hypothetical protein BC835DRAFT_564957 [Cytidiella melzeri]
MYVRGQGLSRETTGARNTANSANTTMTVLHTTTTKFGRKSCTTQMGEEQPGSCCGPTLHWESAWLQFVELEEVLNKTKWAVSLAYRCRRAHKVLTSGIAALSEETNIDVFSSLTTQMAYVCDGFNVASIRTLSSDTAGVATSFKFCCDTLSSLPIRSNASQLPNRCGQTPSSAQRFTIIEKPRSRHPCGKPFNLQNGRLNLPQIVDV